MEPLRDADGRYRWPKYVTTRSHVDVDSDDPVYLVLKSLILYSVPSGGNRCVSVVSMFPLYWQPGDVTQRRDEFDPARIQQMRGAARETIRKLYFATTCEGAVVPETNEPSPDIDADRGCHSSPSDHTCLTSAAAYA